MKTGPSLAKALRLAKAARGGRLKDREGVAKPSPIGIFWSSLSRGVFALETAKAVPPYQGEVSTEKACLRAWVVDEEGGLAPCAMVF